jgi:hypothetical protein
MFRTECIHRPLDHFLRIGVLELVIHSVEIDDRLGLCIIVTAPPLQQLPYAEHRGGGGYPHERRCAEAAARRAFDAVAIEQPLELRGGDILSVFSYELAQLAVHELDLSVPRQQQLRVRVQEL